MRNTVITLTLNPAIDETVQIDDFASGKVNRVINSSRYPGGKGINVAVFLADYSLNVISAGFLGKTNDAIFNSMFKLKGIMDKCFRIDGSTRIGIKIIDQVKSETTDINYPGITPADKDIKNLYDAIEDFSKKHKWFVFSGSIPSGLSSDIYCDLIRIIKKNKGFVLLDTSGDAFRNAVESGPYLIKPNIDELSEYAGMELTSVEEIIKAGRKFFNYGIKIVIISMGEKGALFLNNEYSISAVPPSGINVVSTVGAGDAMVSGALCALVHKISFPDLTRMATAFSMSAVMSIELGLSDRNLIAEYMKEVKLEYLDY
ncbi:MAG: 1-phosphofructokinase [Spirochaetes bacterium]|nr:1-phosphofructokinase [Spirochaetota bacterium]